MTAALAVRAASVVVDGRSLLDDVSVELHPGEVLALVGPNGAGKSTLLSLLAGDRVPDRGVVEVGGEPIGAVGHRALARRRAVLLQSNEVSFPFLVTEVVAMGRAPWRGRPEAEDDDDRVAAALEVAELAGFAARRMPGLSGGERARVAFARIHAQACRILLLDEPTAALDIRHQERLLGAVRTHAASGGAAIVVLHDLTLAAAFADRVAVLEGGRLRAVGPPAAVLTAELLTEIYRHPVRIATVDDELVVLPSRNLVVQEAAVHV